MIGNHLGRAKLICRDNFHGDSSQEEEEKLFARPSLRCFKRASNQRGCSALGDGTGPQSCSAGDNCRQVSEDALQPGVRRQDSVQQRAVASTSSRCLRDRSGRPFLPRPSVNFYQICAQVHVRTFVRDLSDQTEIAIATISIAVRKPRIAKLATTQATEVREGLSSVPRRALTRCVKFSTFSIRAG
jgi:hypothetical protein